MTNRLLGFLSTPGKTQLTGVYKTPATAWGFWKPLLLPGVSGNPCYCLGFLEPLLLPGVSRTPTTAWGFWNPLFFLRVFEPLLLPGVFETPATAWGLKPLLLSCLGFETPIAINGSNPHLSTISSK